MILIILDMQFKSLKDTDMVRVTFNVEPREEHVNDVERYHRVIN